MNVALEQAERILRADGQAPDLHLQQAGNYPIQVMMNVLKLYGSVELQYTKDADATLPGTYLLGDGHHWQVASDSSGTWILHDGGIEFPIADIQQLLRQRRHRDWGAALHVRPLAISTPPTTIMETDPSGSKGAIASAAFEQQTLEECVPLRKQRKPTSPFLSAFANPGANVLQPTDQPVERPPQNPFTVPRVKCSGHRQNPSQAPGRQTEHPVYLGRCTNCLRPISHKGHTEAPPLNFVDEATFTEFLSQFKELAALEDEQVA